ncbi:MAG: hypothetical protein ACRDN0_05850 [Trebonia sp.]
MRDLIAAERIRLLSLRSTHIFLACSFVIAVAAACLLCAKLNIRPEDRASFPSADDAFSADTGGLLMAIAGCFGAATMTGEYSSGLIRTMFTAVPARGRSMLARAVTLAALAGIAGAAATIAVITASQVILAPGHYPALLSQPHGLRAAIAFTLLMPLGAVTGVAFGALLRSAVAAVTAVVAVLALLPGLLSGLLGPAARDLTAYGAWSVLSGQQASGTSASAALSWLILCGWPAIAFMLAAVVVQRRDV